MPALSRGSSRLPADVTSRIETDRALAISMATTRSPFFSVTQRSDNDVEYTPQFSVKNCAARFCPTLTASAWSSFFVTSPLAPVKKM